MKPTPEPIDAIYREKVLRARRQPLAEKLLDGPRLYAIATEFAKAGIRAQNPEADEAEVLEILKGRLAIIKRIEEYR